LYSKLRIHGLVRVAVLTLLTTSAAVAQAQPPAVTTVEPPSWWAKHTINPVRLLIRGRNLTGASLRARAPLRVSETKVNPAGTYVFVNVTIPPQIQPGAHSLTLVTRHGQTSVPFRIERPSVTAGNFQGINNDDVIYLIMPDRFANGDPNNDRPAGAPPEATDRKNPRAFHGGDLRGIIDRLDYLKELGVTALWLTPWYDNWNGITQCDNPWCPHTYYHGYHAIDYYAFEDRFGDMETLRELVTKAHGLGIKIIQDQVANHVGSRHPWTTDSPDANWFHGTLSNHTLNKFKNSVLLSPNANVLERTNVLNGWFNDDLPDMNQENPEVSRYEIQNSLWWIGMTGLDGIRQDTIQYMPRSFIRELSDALHRQYPRMWMVGEVFERDAAHTAFFLGGKRGWDGIDTHLDSVFDFALSSASRQVFTDRVPMYSLRDQMKYDALYADPARVTTMVGNHDTVRFMSLPHASHSGAMLHMAFTISVRGTPQLYYGEEIAMAGSEDPDNRRDFPGGFPGDSRNAFQASGRTADEQRMFEWTRDWLRLRAEHSAMRRGRSIDLFYDDEVYIFARQDERETVVLAFNRSAPEKRIVIPVGVLNLQTGAALVPVLGSQPEVKVSNDTFSLTLPEKTAVAYVVRK
jgi:glycosidase